MYMSIVDEKLQIQFTWKEQLLAVRCQKIWEIPLAHIEQVTITKPQSNWKDLRAPGTFIPGVIKAGTYYTNRGKEFWYTDKQTNYLTIELKDESYKRIILTIDNNESWQQKLTHS
ncbi:hypothetical protein I8751_25900 [Nostocaceae cyanobacterium CENA357]|uniref:Uncharacterized protein n=1 Tax=Atlanticothrix silvestris CENA357 TaxID=1725252 RepID=A0A8J7HI72_9CYAN|nr:hypothetical protein [Atlanticothrix silvestris]MBH8555717.1 hypothetical protein [Atlanticothrix silvestris CENA357]